MHDSTFHKYAIEDAVVKFNAAKSELMRHRAEFYYMSSDKALKYPERNSMLESDSTAYRR